MADYAFSVPVQDVKNALLKKLGSGGWTVFDDHVASISFRRNNGREFGSFLYSRNLFPREPPKTTCVLSLLKGAEVANPH